ncbi:hypothetical protein B296_00033939 [Ensete ventricosum]|uniref:Uncharacterized protein n=1 Tax=Ensete ventricosum TaxID=4639 RepID=A0A426XHA6_ENSVE|nr:hypothetical protein B296_00033939 [Ensete ventricosum]
MGGTYRSDGLPVCGPPLQTRLQLLERLMRSATTNKTSVKLGTLRERRKRNLVRQLGKGATKRDLQRWKPASMFLKRAWKNFTKAKEGSLG